MKKLYFIVLILCLVITGCQKTPEKSSVVSKKGGLDKDLILEPYQNGEKRTTDIPEQWEMNEKKSNGRVTIAADLNFGNMEIGNLPVTEWKNRVLSEKELIKLVSYFAKDEEVYVPQIYTKDVYQNVISRIENKEGAYGDVSLWTFYKDIDNVLKQAVELAPDKPSQTEKAEIKFQNKIADPALEKAISWSSVKVSENTDKSIYFQADLGDKRAAHIKAETYEPSAGNSSSFRWEQGAGTVGDDGIQDAIMKNKYANKTEYTEKFGAVLNQFESFFKEEPFGEKYGEEQARQILNDLDINDMKVSSCKKVLWFPKGAISEPENKGVGFPNDSLWQADLKEAEAGYRYTFSRAIEGLSVLGENTNSFIEKTDDTYTSPFPVEAITITITASGIKGFIWKAMSEEVDTIAENTKLISFNTIQDQLADQIFYFYSVMGQPANDTSTVGYNVIDSKLGYTYITAFGKPENAWLVPAWFFTVKESMNGTAYQEVPYIIDALDGRVITW